MLHMVESLQAVSDGDLKDAYFDVPVEPHHRQFLCFAFDRQEYQLWLLPFGLSPSPWFCTRCDAAALSPLQAWRM